MRLLLASMLLVCSIFASSEPLAIKGFVFDAETKEPIPFAHVVFGDIITLTNLDGEFVITPHRNDDNPNLQVSVMGYEIGNQSIEDLTENYEIYLKPSTIELEEVTILSGHVLMADVFNRFHLNYEVSRQHMLGYYKEDLYGSDSIYYIAEGIVDIYVPPNVASNQALVRPIKTRKKVFKPIEDHVMFLTGNASDMAKSSIWRKDSFLSDKNRKNYDFVYDGMSKIGDKDVFIIYFEPINSKGNTTGKIYIEEKSLAVLKLEYHPIIKNTVWKSVSWTEEFYEKNGIYELFRVSYSGTWEEFDQDYTYDALLVVNESTPASDIPLSRDFLTEKHSFFHEALEDFTDAFWEGYNFIKIDLESAQMMSNQGVQLSY